MNIQIYFEDLTSISAGQNRDTLQIKFILPYVLPNEQNDIILPINYTIQDSIPP